MLCQGNDSQFLVTIRHCLEVARSNQPRVKLPGRGIIKETISGFVMLIVSKPEKNMEINVFLLYVYL